MDWFRVIIMSGSVRNEVFNLSLFLFQNKSLGFVVLIIAKCSHIHVVIVRKYSISISSQSEANYHSKSSPNCKNPNIHIDIYIKIKSIIVSSLIKVIINIYISLLITIFNFHFCSAAEQSLIANSSSPIESQQ